MKPYLWRLLLPLIVLLMGVAIGYTYGKYGAAPGDLRCELRAAPTATAVAPYLMPSEAFRFYPSGDTQKGKLWYADGQWHFEGDADASAKAFWDGVILTTPRTCPWLPIATPLPTSTPTPPPPRVCIETRRVDAVVCTGTLTLVWKVVDGGYEAYCWPRGAEGL